MWSGLIWLMLAQPPAEHRCLLRVSESGIFVDGDPMGANQAIGACKRTSGATVVVKDDAPADVWPALRLGLEHAHVKIYMRGVIGDHDCMENPLAKGCR